MKNFVLFTFLVGASSISWAQTYLTPKQLGSGNLPGIYASLVFTLSDGNWIRQVNLPAQAEDKASIKIISKATYKTQVMQANSDVPLPALTLMAGQSLEYQYSAGLQRWEIAVPTVWPIKNGGTFSMTSSTELVQRVAMRKGAWAHALNLPTTALNGAVMLVKSKAHRPSLIDPSQVMHASTMPLRTDDEYAFVFNARLGKWVLYKGPETTASLSSLRNGQLPVPITALTSLTLPAGTSATTLRLPVKASDRDRVVIRSLAEARSTIANTNVFGLGTMTVGFNESYDFMWNAEAATWVPLNMPRTVLNTASLLGSTSPAPSVTSFAMLPPVQTPVTEVVTVGGSKTEDQVKLSNQALVGDRVVVRSTLPGGLLVAFPQGNTDNTYRVGQDEEVAFVKEADGWSRETETIRILLAYSQTVAAQFGPQAARARQLESLRMTNEALENSGARFRFQVAGLMEVPSLGKTLNDAVVRGKTDVGIQAERDRVLADAVYYEGTESGCGLAWVNSKPLAMNMLGTGSTMCGTTVMRHELGHNMGVGHGNGVVYTVMSGNQVSSFATPHRFDPSLRVHRGHGAKLPDEVTPMDKNAPAVARFR